MKKLLIVAAAFTFSAFTNLHAQVKLGHINSTTLLQAMPETKVADSVLTKFGNSLQDQLRTMSGEYDKKIADYKSKEANMADPIKETMVKDITDLEDRIREFQTAAQENIQKKKEELYQPIIKKADDAIKAVAKEKSYNYVFDSGVGVLLYANDSEDIMSAVKQKLGLK
ncbi:MAG: OmpH family outer membrane protein [Bacteroidia bacterium]|nr:OmpH family outer membrane protein [Bacteroidia bacterium]